MSFDRVPSKSEVMGWNPHQLSDYMRRLELSGCDKVIVKCNINGQRFLNMSENDIQKFPKVHSPLISKICCEINRKEEKRPFFAKRSTAPKYHEPDTSQEVQPWGPDEFDDDDDDDYVSPDADDDDGSVGDYEYPTEGPEVGGEDSDNDYEPPPSEPPDEIPHKLFAAKRMADDDYIDSTPHRGTAVRQPPPPPQRPGPGPPLPSASRPSLVEPPPPRREQSPQRLGRLPVPAPFSSAPPAPLVDRRIKPTKLDRTNLTESPVPARKLNTTDRPAPHLWRPQAEERSPDPPRMPKPPLPLSARVIRSSSSVGNNRYVPGARNEVRNEVSMAKSFNSNTFPRPGLPRPPLPSDCLPPNIATTASRLQASFSHRSKIMPVPSPVQASMPPPADLEDEQDMNPQWYVGQVSRGQAESCLRRVNKDGAFLVRDSSKRSSIQPYTLMVLYQDKVYNIQIRCEQNEFLLGTGLKGSETFPMVAHIINHYRQQPLLLIDAKNREAGQQNQCPLIYPAGLRPSF
ncbi:lymphocyte cytosolic protein 2-like [Oncorhynchus clarkii lewisi]|uniref:lymphocyte cytosolic protein 2-like n=1 Tax=Oncorhynchus clarkii lewisi TaxID=490388 RepID=UPI0039B92B54